VHDEEIKKAINNEIEEKKVIDFLNKQNAEG